VRHGLSLTQQNALRLAVVFVAFELVAAIAVMSLLMLPMARRAANDFGELLAISAKTWSELPPETRPAFVRQLTGDHGIALLQEPPPDVSSRAGHGPYVRQLERALSAHFRQEIAIVNSRRSGEEWHWAALPTGGRTLWLGFPHSRVGTQPVTTIVITLVTGFALAIFAAYWLSRRIIAPLKRLDAAAATLGRGETPELLPESGPKELAALACRVNALVREVHDLLEGRTTLLAGLSHDLRTPLARMRLTIEMLERRPDPKWIERLNTDIDEMNGLVGNMLELARGLGREAPVPVDVCQLLEDLAQDARDAGSHVQVVAERCTIEAPPMALRRLLGNLVVNAQRYGGDSALELRGTRSTDAVRLGVLDRGPGIPAAQIEAVFRPFHRVDSSRSATTGGAGLGLTIVRQLAQANGWTVSLENRPDGGLAAWVTLPTGIRRSPD